VDSVPLPANSRSLRSASTHLPTISRIVILSEVRTRSVQTQSKGSAVRGLDTAARDRRSLYSG